MRPERSTASSDEPIAVLYRSDGERLWRAVYAYARDREIANDAVAEAFAQCIRRGEAVRDPRAWVWRATFAIARGELARRDRTAGIHAVADRSEEDESDLGALLDALGRLPPQQRAAVVLRHYEGYRPREAARVLGITPATLRVHLARARRTLARILVEEEP